MSSELRSKAHVEATFLGILYRQYTKPKTITGSVHLTGQTAIVTGSNVGLGFEASRQLLQRGVAHLVMGVRSRAKGDAAADALRKEFPESIITVWIIDQESYDSVRAFVDQCATLPRIDIVLLNAALVKQTFDRVGTAGHETTLQVNYLSTALLAIMLLPLLKAKAKSRGEGRPPVMSIVTSDLAYVAKVEKNLPLLQQLDKSDGFSSVRWYAITKLFLTIFVAKLAKSVNSDDVLVNLVNPGMTKGTGFGSDTPKLLRLLFAIILSILARSTEIGATTYIDAVVSYGAESHGSFISDWAIKPYPEVMYTSDGEELTNRLWQETMEELKFVNASGIIDKIKSE